MRVLVLLSISMVVFVSCCGTSVEPPPYSDTEQTDAGPDALVLACDAPEANVASCEYCMAHGCDHPWRQTDQCEFGVAVYEFFAGCTDNPDVKTNCFDVCPEWGVNHTITQECIECARPYCGCSFDCFTEIVGINP